MEARYAYVGTYTDKGSEGVQIVSVDGSTGRMVAVGESDAVPNPSFLALDQESGLLYAVLEVDSYSDRPEGAVAAFEVTDGGRSLRLRSTAGSGGSGPCHLALSHDHRYVAVANYGSGSVSVIRADRSGGLGRRTAWVQHSGAGPHPERQEGPHAHSATFSPAGGSLIVADLGTDSLNVYTFDPAEGSLSLHEQVSVGAGSGPRHAAFHPSGSVCYVSHELSSEVEVFSWSEASRQLGRIAAASTRPEEASAEKASGVSSLNTVADIHVSPSGRHVYCSNRGDDTITLFSADPSGRGLRFETSVSSGGRTPRNFALVDGTDLLIAANQDGDNLVSFHVDTATGRLAPTGHSLSLSRPVCVVASRV